MRTQRWTLVVVCAATAMLMLDIAVVNTALSRIAEDLDTGLSGLQWVVDAYTLALASTVLTAGALADRLGRRRLFLIIAVGVAALGALVPAQAAFGAGSPQEYVDGLHDALLVGAALAAAGAVAAWLLISPRFGAAAPAPAELDARAEAEPVPVPA